MAKSKCTNILPFIPLLVDGALSATESHSIEKHLSVCPDCRREFDLYRAMKQTAASLPTPSLSSDFHENLMKTIAVETTAAPKRARVLRPSFLRHAMGFAAAAAVVALSVVTLSQVSFLNMPKASPSDNLDDFVTQSQVTELQVAQPQVTQSQGAQSQGAQPQVVQPRVTAPKVATPIADEPTRSIDSQVTPSQVTPSQVAPSQVAPSQATPHQDAPAQESTAPAASCGILAEEIPQQKFVTYRVFIEKAYLAEAQGLLADCTLDAHGYRADNGAAPLLKALSALPGYRTECIENDAAQTDYILLIGE